MRQLPLALSLSPRPTLMVATGIPLLQGVALKQLPHLQYNTSSPTNLLPGTRACFVPVIARVGSSRCSYRRPILCGSDKLTARHSSMVVEANMVTAANRRPSCRLSQKFLCKVAIFSEKLFDL